MRHPLHMESWARKDHFDFFSRFEEPFFGVTVELDCKKTYDQAKETGHSFFLCYLHKALLAANFIESFRYRIIEGKVWVYDQVNASPTINRPDGTFGFGYMNFEQDFNVFATNARIEMDRVRNSTGLEPAISGENVIHFSSIPWIRFTALSHARSFSHHDSIPKISFGKMIPSGDTLLMPVSVHAHHGLMDGYQVGQFLDYFQELLSR